ncbi:unnamed protein product [Dicrocoelium dendriticum]|nr:unnamed protein product [Dicrocoelium dendriticum]
MHIVTGWTVSFHTSELVLDIPGYHYVMDLFSASELPPEWCNFNNIVPYRIFPTYRLQRKQDERIDRMLFAPLLTSRNLLVKDSSTGTLINNGPTPLRIAPSAATSTLVDSPSEAGTQAGLPVPNLVTKPKRISQVSWNAAVRKMAQKRFPNISRSESHIRRARSLRERRWRIPEGGSFPRPRSPDDTMGHVRFGLQLQEASVPTAFSAEKHTSTTMPHEMRYYAYESPQWEIRLRKEYISPGERIRTASMVHLLFAQLLGDLFCPVMPRLCHEDRERLLELLGNPDKQTQLDRYAHVPIELKKAAVAASLKSPLYFGRFFPVLILNAPGDTNECQWLVVGHHGLRLVYQNPNQQDFDIRITFTLSEVKQVTAARIPTIPGWRLADCAVDGKDSVETVSVTGGDSQRLNLVTIIGQNDKLQLYTDMADRVCKIINKFLDEYQEEVSLKIYVQGISKATIHQF